MMSSLCVTNPTETLRQHVGVPTVKFSPWISVHVARTNVVQTQVCLHVIVLKGSQPHGRPSDNYNILNLAVLLLAAFTPCIPFCADFSNASGTMGNSPSLTGHLLPIALTTASATLHA